MCILGYEIAGILRAICRRCCKQNILDKRAFEEGLCCTHIEDANPSQALLTMQHCHTTIATSFIEANNEAKEKLFLFHIFVGVFLFSFLLAVPDKTAK